MRSRETLGRLLLALSVVGLVAGATFESAGSCGGGGGGYEIQRTLSSR